MPFRQPATSPNILFVFSDQQRSTAMGCAGEKVRTPNLDALAAQGVRFTNALSNTPVCTPARGSLMTGLHALSHGAVTIDQEMPVHHPTIARSLNAAGYRCGYVGKWHLGGRDRGRFLPPGPSRLGFDDYWAANECGHRYFQSFYYLNEDPTPRWIDGYEPEEQTDLAIDYLKSQRHADSPFCLFVSWGPPHDPYTAVPEHYRDLYPPGDIALRSNVPSEEVIRQRLIPGYTQRADKVREEIAGYYAHCTALDDCFGRLMTALDDAGLTDNTLVVYTSDHGDMLYAQGYQRKRLPFRESVGVPLIMRWPGRIPTAELRDAPIGLVDLPQTILGLAGVGGLESAEGHCYSDYVFDSGVSTPDEVFISQPIVPPWWPFEAWRGVVTRTHTYARDLNGPWILFDDREDPLQTNNLLETGAAGPVAADMDDRLNEWLSKLNDPFESSRKVADRYCPVHEDTVVPVTLSEEIRAEIRRRETVS